MKTTMTVTPAYGRDYKSAQAAVDDWRAGKDFIVADVFNQWYGKPVSRRDLNGPTEVRIRYGNLRKVTTYSEGMQ